MTSNICRPVTMSSDDFLGLELAPSGENDLFLLQSSTSSIGTSDLSFERNEFSDNEKKNEFSFDSSGSSKQCFDDVLERLDSLNEKQPDNSILTYHTSLADSGTISGGTEFPTDFTTTLSSQIKCKDHPISAMTENEKIVTINDIEIRKATSTNEKTLESNLPAPSQYTTNSKLSSKERPTICPICFKDVVTHFTRHLFRHHKNHKEVVLLEKLKPRSKERLMLVSSLRKQGNFILKTEKNIDRPVKPSKKKDVKYFVCTHCLGQYTKHLLFKHVKVCKNKPQNNEKTKGNCLTVSQTFMAMINSKNTEFLKTSRLKDEVFSIMRADDVSATVKGDILICLYGETLLSKHKRKQIANVVSNKIREMGRLLIELRKLIELKGMFDVLKPEQFQYIISATKIITGYNSSTKSFTSPSLALHMGTNLKTLCDVALKLVIEKKNIPGISWEIQADKKTEIKDLKKLIEGHWCNELSSLALKNLKENHWEKPLQLPLTQDLELFNDHLQKLASEIYQSLNIDPINKKNFKLLTECVLAKTIIFNRKRVGDVQYLTTDNYNKDFSTVNQESFEEALTQVEKIICRNHKRIITGGKGSKPVPILFSRQYQKYISLLLKIRKNHNIVPASNPYLFASPDSENRWISGANAIRKLAKNCGAKQPELLTSTRFRKQIATTLQLMALDEDEMEQIATFMGHTKKTHAEFYRLPQDIYQTAKVAKVLLLMEKGKGAEFRGKSLDEIDVGDEAYRSSDSEDDGESFVDKVKRKVILDKKDRASEMEYEERIAEEYVDINPVDDEPQRKTKARTGRMKWSADEKKLVLNHFEKHIAKKITPKKHECEQLIALHHSVLKDKDWVRVKTFVYNTFRLKMND